MGFEDITNETIKGTAIRELQGLQCAVVTGTTAATDIALAGATVKKTTLVAVLREDATTGVTLSNLVSEAAITSDGNLQLDTTNTTGSSLIVWFTNKA